jgi:hypothetical protein
MNSSDLGSSLRQRRLLLGACLVAAGAAQAAVGPPLSPPGPGGGMTDIPYGTSGNVYQLEPLLFVQGLGAPNNPLAVAALNPSLAYSFSVSGAGTSWMKIDYRIRNLSGGDVFNQLRFVLFANPDGGGNADFLSDVLQETWGGALAGDPVLREGRDFNPVDTIVDHFKTGGNLTAGHDPNCLASPGCDATLGLQWNAATLGPGETFRVLVGLSDDGQHLSWRYLDVIYSTDPATHLTVSGVSSIVPVPEPGSAWMLAAGLAAVGAARRLRRRD